MITITVKKKNMKLVAINGVGHADWGSEERKTQICSAVSILSNVLGSQVGQHNRVGFGRFDLIISPEAKRSAEFALYGFEILNMISPENVHIRNEWTFTRRKVAAG